MNMIDLARGIREHRAFGRRDVRGYNAHLAGAVEFACLADANGLLIEPLGWSMLLARGGDVEAEAEEESAAPTLPEELIEAGWMRIGHGEEGFDLILSALSTQCSRRRIRLEAEREEDLVFWLAPDGEDGLKPRPPEPDAAKLREAMDRILKEGVPEGFQGERHWFVRHPEAPELIPVKAVWGVAVEASHGGGFSAAFARDRLRRAGFTVPGPDQGAADLAESPESVDQLPAALEGAERQITRNMRERDPVARAASEKAWRAAAEGRLVCQGCGIDFGKTYGPRGEGFMHFHHQSGVEPPRDLVPVCPNCHAMIHRGETALSLSELQALITRKETK